MQINIKVEKMKQKEELTETELKDLPKTALARKYKCSPQYVGQVLRGEKGNTRSYLAVEKTVK